MAAKPRVGRDEQTLAQLASTGASIIPDVQGVALFYVVVIINVVIMLHFPRLRCSIRSTTIIMKPSTTL